MFDKKRVFASIVALIVSFSSVVMAGTFTPAAGTTITSSSVEVGWTSTASQQWVRAYDAGGVKIFDSGRQSMSTGQVTVPVPASASQLQVVFYEKNSAGQWISEQRTYSVSIGGGTGGGGTGGGASDGDTLAGLSCSQGEVAKYIGGSWRCAEDDDSGLGAGDVINAIEALFCAAGEELTRTNTGKLACVGETTECPFAGLIADTLLDTLGGLTIETDETSACFGEDATDIFISLVADGDEVFELRTGVQGETTSTNNVITRDTALACAIAIGCENFGPE